MKGDAFKYMSNLGYTFGFEYVRKGYAFVYKDMFRVTVTQIFKFESPHDISTLSLLDPTNTWLVEVSSISIIQEAVAKTVEEINSFKTLFTGIVDLGYVDHLYLLNKVTYRS
ncbi:hypothetical protein K493DRAFT_354096 [Basidiobolus meristosporus CBS 931.73]|uniref:Mediator of RNA polymerase II transcription subunit 18 n=1 Tax=Basidiobolus meristosporus CBS 931.73 TaxID=1314790 RepID=A0A1Y1Y482_9FUNG|nr:hypothetical protein K493DRAFT_354096 [Basidiobolus meristosporus CBS 931.73]|eukprot:ORX92779.1 hypothetical protein K493DRAFT_354096 [Basidiobolus meristosporus CBS 931.73]